ncbi:MAG: hypothetical protein SGI74_01265 [Oligoflexia bacterium]|nr:hypothetical protein [Oligoflexia bacterium]
MEKISKIIPASTRQVLISGEIPKPRRMTEPNAVESGPAFQRVVSSPLPVTPITETAVKAEAPAGFGQRLDLTA